MEAHNEHDESAPDPWNEAPVNTNEHPRERQARLRRDARSLAMKVLFESDLSRHDALDILFRYLADEEVEAEASEYAEHLLRGVVADLPAIDAIIGDAATAFPVDQLPAVDRNVLRVAVYELRSEDEVPVKTTINEAIDIAKEFGGENSGRFVNGVLGTIAEGVANVDVPKDE